MSVGPEEYYYCYLDCMYSPIVIYTSIPVVGILVYPQGQTLQYQCIYTREVTGYAGTGGLKEQLSMEVCTDRSVTGTPIVIDQ